MKKIRMWVRALTFIMAIAMVAGSMPLFALAEDEENRIAEFNEETITESVEAGTAIDDITAELPDKIPVTMENGAQANVDVTWETSNYDPATAAAGTTYTFSAVMDPKSGYKLGKDATMPTAKVTLLGAPRAGGSGAIHTLTPPTGSPIALINENTGAVSYYATIALAAAQMTSAVEYSLVVCAAYTSTAADLTAVAAVTSPTKLNISSTYHNGSTNVTSILTFPGYEDWLCGTETEFHNINLVSSGGTCKLIARGHALTMGVNVKITRNFLSVYGGSNGDYAGNSNLTVLSGSYANIYGGNSTGTMTGDIVVNAGGTATIHNLCGASSAMGSGSTVTMNLDGSNGIYLPQAYGVGSAVSNNIPADGTVTINLKNIISLTQIDASRNNNGSATVNIEGDVKITAELISKTAVVLKENAYLVLGNTLSGTYDVPKKGQLSLGDGQLVMGANSRLTCSGYDTKEVKDIVVNGAGAQIDIYKDKAATVPITVNGSYISAGGNQLLLGTCTNPNLFIGESTWLQGLAGDVLLHFASANNAAAANYEGVHFTVAKNTADIVIDSALTILNLFVENYANPDELQFAKTYDEDSGIYTLTFTKSDGAKAQDIQLILNGVPVDLSQATYSCEEKGDKVTGSVERGPDGKVTSVTVEIVSTNDNIVLMGCYLGTVQSGQGGSGTPHNGEIESAYTLTGSLVDADMKDQSQENYQKALGTKAYLYKTAEWTDKANGKATITLTGLEHKGVEVEGPVLYSFQVCIAHSLRKDIVQSNIEFLLNAYGKVDLMGIDAVDLSYGIVYQFNAAQDKITDRCNFATDKHFFEAQIMALYNYLFDDAGNQVRFPAVIYVSSDSYRTYTDESELVAIFGGDKAKQVAKVDRLMTLLKKYADAGRYFYMTSPSYTTASYDDARTYMMEFLPAFMDPSIYTDTYGSGSSATVTRTYEKSFEALEGMTVWSKMAFSDTIASKFKIDGVRSLTNGLTASSSGQNVTAQGTVTANKPAQVAVDVTLNNLNEFNSWIDTNNGNATLACESSGSQLSVGSPKLALTETAPLMVKKIVTADEGVAIPTDDAFTFQVETDSSGAYASYANKTYKLFGSDDVEITTETYTTDGDGKFTLNAGQYAVFQGLDTATGYRVTETAMGDNYAQTLPVNNAAVTGTIVSGGSTAEFTNKYTAPPSLTVKKIVTTDAGVTAPTDDAFTFTIEIGAPLAAYASQTYKLYQKGADGLDDTEITTDAPYTTTNTGTFTLKGGQYAVFDGLNAGTAYRVTETESGDNYTQTSPVDSTGAATAIRGMIAEGNNMAEFTNKYNPPPLTVSKTVDGQYGKDTQEFDFTISAYLTPEGGTGETAFTGSLNAIVTTPSTTEGGAPTTAAETVAIPANGIGTFTLKHGQSYKFTNIPEGARVVVQETEVVPYITTYQIDAGSATSYWPVVAPATSPTPPEVTMNASHTIAFTNTNNTPPVAGVTIRKYVIGAYADTAKKFTFHIAAGYLSENPEDSGTSITGPLHYYLESDPEQKPVELTLTDGVGTVQLAHGEGIVITDMPNDGVIMVMEDPEPNYTTQFSVDGQTREDAQIDSQGVVSTGPIGLNGAATKQIYLYNTRSDIVETGIRLGGSGGNGNSVLLLVVTSLLLVLTLTGLVIVLRNRRPARRARH